MALTVGTWRHVSGMVGSQPITEVSTTAKHPLGQIVQARDVGTTAYGQGEFQYVKGVASCAAKDWLGIPSDDFVAIRAIANGNYPLGIAMAAITASYYGWVQIGGKAIANCLTLFADNGFVNLTNTAGVVDDASVIGDLVVGALGASTAVVGNLHAEFEIYRPYAGQRVSVAN